MARHKNGKLTAAAVTIGSTMGKVDRQARGAARKAQAARKEMREQLIELSKLADRLSRDLKKANKRLRHAIG